MKIEKLNEDKIRITLNLDDLKEKNIDFHTFMSNSIESQSIFLDMLDEAEKKVGFVTDDYKIMIEAIALNNGSFILTVTRFAAQKPKNTYKRKKVNIKRKKPNINCSKAIYEFTSFDNFCEFCGYLQKNNCTTSLSKFQLLYEYNNKYYFVLSDINTNSQNLKFLCSTITEFAHFVNYSDLFERKLMEYGNLIMKNNAVKTCVKHFCKA